MRNGLDNPEAEKKGPPTPGGDVGKTGGAPVVGMRDTVLTFVAQIVGLSLGLVWQFLLAHFLDTAGRGAYAVATQYAGLLTVIFMLGVDVGSIYHVAARKMTVSEAAMTLLVYSLLGSAVAIPVGLLLMHTGWEYFEKAEPLSFYIMVAVIPLSFFSSSLIYFLTSLREFAWLAVLIIAGPALNLTSFVVFVWALGWGVNGALLTLILTGAVIGVVVLVILRRRHGLHFVWPTGAQFRQVLGFGVRYYFGKVSNIMNFQLGTLVLAFFATKSEIGVFAFGLTLVERVQFLPDTLTTVLLPRVSSDVKGRVELVMQCNRIVIVLAGAALAVLSALAWPAFALLVPTFMPAVITIWILAPGVWIRCASKLFVPYLHSQNRVGITSIAVFAGAVANIAILAGLMPYMGIQAAALSVVGNYAVSATILVVAFHRVSGMSVRDAWQPRRSDLAWFWQGVMAFWRRLRPAVAEK
jgi:O-antigen/teichoic acid export membrane protein